MHSTHITSACMSMFYLLQPSNMHNIDHVEPYQGASITQRETYATCDDFMFVAPIKYTQHLSCPTK